MTIHIDADRLRSDFDELAAIGGTAEGGVERLALSPAHLEARRWFLRRAAAAGLGTSIDAAGNHSAILRSASPDARTFLLGSHLDSVPNGGRFDGALGVVAALEVLRTVKEHRLDLPVTLEAIDFTDEEGTLVGLLGSLAVAGVLDAEALAAPRGGRDALLAGLASAGLKEARLGEARRDPRTLAGYLELHIEQGPVLERARVEIGVVRAIVGSRSLELVFEGASAHAGTTPMAARRDAGLGAARFVDRVHDAVTSGFPGAVATVGHVELEPGAFNVVPGSARVLLEFRAGSAAELDRLEQRLLHEARAVATAQRLDLRVQAVGRWEPSPLDASARAAITAAAASLGLSSIELPSGAGHDAQALAQVTRAGMVFVPSVGGVSHQPGELTHWQDCVNGANALLHSTVRLALEAPT